MARRSQSAAHVTRLDIVNSRIVVNAMEPRAAIAAYDRKNARTYLACAEPGRLRHARHLAEVLGVNPAQVHL